VAEPRRDDFPNNFVGDLVPTERGWVVVVPTCCPDGHDYRSIMLPPNAFRGSAILNTPEARAALITKRRLKPVTRLA
jgi:hypothetical protein